MMTISRLFTGNITRRNSFLSTFAKTDSNTIASFTMTSNPREGGGQQRQQKQVQPVSRRSFSNEGKGVYDKISFIGAGKMASGTLIYDKCYQHRYF